jgi:hypothetical protein
LLSGLLNIINSIFYYLLRITAKLIPSGIILYKGWILVIITNYVKKLDPVLICPGYIDYKMKFENAIRKQIEELFKRIYTSSIKAVLNLNSNRTATSIPASSITKPGKEKLGIEELSYITGEFAKKVPGSMFSPAKIQGFLLK